MQKNPIPKLCEVIVGGPEQRFTCKELYVGDASLQHYGPSNWVWLRLDIKQNHWSILKRSCISYWYRAGVQMYSHRPWSTADIEAETDVCTQNARLLTTSNDHWLNGAGQWLGLPGNRTLHQWTSSYRATLKPWLTCHQLILKRTFLPILLRQQLPGIFERISVFASSSAVYQGRWPYIWTPALNWYEIQLFFRVLQWFCFMFNLSQTQFDGLQHCKDTSPTYSSLTIYLCFGPPYHPIKFGHEVFLHPVYLEL